MGTYRLELQTIEKSLRDVQRVFPKINDLLHSRRDAMTDEVVENMMAGYTFIDKAISDGTDLLAPPHITCLLELNHIVLCGLDPNVRTEYQTHIEATTQRFYEQQPFNIDDILAVVSQTRWQVGMETCSRCLRAHPEPASTLHRRQSPHRVLDHELHPGPGRQSPLCAQCEQRQSLLRSLNTRQEYEKNYHNPAHEAAAY